MSSDTVHIARPQRRHTLVSAPHLFLLWKTCGQSGSLLSELSVKPRERSPSSKLMQLNNIIHQSLASANISWNHLDFYRADGKHQEGVTHVPWSDGKFLTWDATCVDRFCSSHRSASAKPEAGGSAAIAEREKAR